MDRESEEHTSELQSHSDLHSFPTRRSSDLSRARDFAYGERSEDIRTQPVPAVARRQESAGGRWIENRKSTRLNSSHTVIYTLSLHDALPIFHELGTSRMGNDPKTSVLNQFQQSHDVKNLLVVDGSSHVSASCQNPTWTIMALAWRSCDHLADEFKRGNL